MRAMLYHSGENCNKSIVPENLRKGNENSYKPKLVSIGPRFRGTNGDLLEMEDFKRRCMSSLLDRVQGNAESNFAKCRELILRLVVPPSYKECGDMDNIMLYDACFVLELLDIGLRDMYLQSSLSMEEWQNVVRDLLVLDNQVPFFILRELYDQLFDGTDDSIETLGLKLFGYKDIPDRSRLSADTKNASNFVELVHSYISMDLKDDQDSDQHNVEIGGDPVQLRRCATMLRAAGVKIKLRDTEIVLQGGFDFRIRFNSSIGTLHIPALYIIETTEARWRNLIAWEHHKMEASGSKTVICKCTSAALFFNALICCESDVQLLKDEGIIVGNLYKSNKDLVTFFRSIIHGINQDITDHCHKIFPLNDLNKYYSHRIRRCTQIPLRLWHYLTVSPREVRCDFRNFLKRGCSYVAVLATIATLLQGFYAVLSYHFPKK